jgi:hypothetical protein
MKSSFALAISSPCRYYYTGIGEIENAASAFLLFSEDGVTIKKSDIFTLRESAKVLGVSENTIQNMLSDGRLVANTDTNGNSYITRDILFSSLHVKDRRPSDAKSIQRLTALCGELEARILLLEDVLLSRADDTESHSKEDLLEIRKLALQELRNSTAGSYASIDTLHSWASDLSKFSCDDASVVGIRLLYTLVEHFLAVYEVYLTSEASDDLLRTKDNLISAKHKLASYAALAGVSVAPDITSLVMTRLRAKSKED